MNDGWWSRAAGYKGRGTAAIRRAILGGELPLLAGKRPIALPIPDIPHETGEASVKVAC